MRICRSELRSGKRFRYFAIVSFGACGLPYFVGGSFDDLSYMAERSVEQFRASGIDLCVGQRVERIDAKAKVAAAARRGYDNSAQRARQVVAATTADLEQDKVNFLQVKAFRDQVARDSRAVPLLPDKLLKKQI